MSTVPVYKEKNHLLKSEKDGLPYALEKEYKDTW